MDTTTDSVTNDLAAAERHRTRMVVMAVAAVALTVAVVFTLTRAEANEAPTHQRVVVTSEGDPLGLLGGLTYAGYVEFEVSTDRSGAVERVMKVSEEPDVLASEINRTLGPVITAWVEDTD